MDYVFWFAFVFYSDAWSNNNKKINLKKQAKTTKNLQNPPQKTQ